MIEETAKFIAIDGGLSCYGGLYCQCFFMRKKYLPERNTCALAIEGNRNATIVDCPLWRDKDGIHITLDTIDQIKEGV